jgi:hypothetical protein
LTVPPDLNPRDFLAETSLSFKSAAELRDTEAVGRDFCADGALTAEEVVEDVDEDEDGEGNFAIIRSIVFAFIPPKSPGPNADLIKPLRIFCVKGSARISSLVSFLSAMAGLRQVNGC